MPKSGNLTLADLNIYEIKPIDHYRLLPQSIKKNLSYIGQLRKIIVSIKLLVNNS